MCFVAFIYEHILYVNTKYDKMSQNMYCKALCKTLSKAGINLCCVVTDVFIIVLRKPNPKVTALS